MDAFYFSADIEENATLCIAPLTRRTAEAVGQSWEQCGGYFLFRRLKGNLDNIEIIAHLESEVAAIDLAELLKLS
ncbi:hypothetical protein [Methylobacterium sp. Leaf94]|uniref:hypothetical protein n=1 Tax=Methylobacterium sp. Leaf94 TaxID=1736250 RepID=UPI0012E389FE|nr:hypothetical protein [Methylobacterium sp. Leaf94]